MNNTPFISVCVPAYKNLVYLQRLLDSVAIQSFTDYEVVITDDSPDTTVKEFIDQYNHSFRLVYKRNDTPLGTPENWNEAVRQAAGTWIKIMHDDDWFSSGDSLKQFVTAVYESPDADFIYCGYSNVRLSDNTEVPVIVPEWKRKRWLADSRLLLNENIIGPPSVTLYKKNKNIYFDSRLKWLVDIDFYIRMLSGTGSAAYIPESLIRIGMGEEQVTRSSSGVEAVEVPEFFTVLEKTPSALSRLPVYDACWRLLRNFRITRVEQIRQLGFRGVIQEHVIQMMSFQKKIDSRFLRNGWFSKPLMALHYFILRN